MKMKEDGMTFWGGTFGWVLLLGGLVAPGMAETATVERPTGGRWDMKPVPVWTVEEAEGRFLTKGKMAVDRDGMVYFLDTEGGRVLSWTGDGVFCKPWGRKGEGPGEFKYPLGLHVVEGRVGVQEFDRLSLFSPTGVFEKTLSFDQRRSPACMDGVTGYFFVGPDNQEQMVLARKNWSEKDFVVRCSYDQGGKRSPGVVIAGMEYPVVCSGGRLYAALPMACTISCWDPTGKTVWETTIQGRVRKPVTREEKIARIGKKRWERLKAYQSNGRGAGEVLLESMPDEDPFYSHLCAMADGRLLALEATQDHHLEGDLFSARGVYQYRCELNLPEGSRLKGRPFIWKDRLLAPCENEDGDLQLASFRIRIPPSA